MKLSVITINRNNAEGLKRTIESVVGQTKMDFEYVVIDGASTDHSREVIEKYGKFIDYWISEPDSGIYHAMNKGIDKVNGDYILFLNSGDYFIDHSIMENIIDELEIFDLISYSFYVSNEENSKVYIKNPPKKLSAKYLSLDTLGHPSTFIKRSLFTKYGYYNEKFKIVADYDFFCLAFKKKATYCSRDLPVTYFHTDGLSSTSPDLLNYENNLVRKKYFIVFFLCNALQTKILNFIKHIKMRVRVRTRFRKIINRNSGVGNNLVSVIMPVYNSALFIGESLQSAMDQTYKDIEIICVDDNSIDNSIEIIKNYQKIDPRIKLVENKNNSGPAYSRNIGIRESKGKYILPLDSDDIIDKTYIEKAVSILNQGRKYSVVYSKAMKFGTINEAWNLPEYNPEIMPYGNMVFCSALYRRSDWEKYSGYDTELSGYEDWDFWLNFVEEKKKFYRINEVLFLYRQHNVNSVNRKAEENYSYLFEQIRKKHSRLYRLEKTKKIIKKMKMRIRIRTRIKQLFRR